MNPGPVVMRTDLPKQQVNAVVDGSTEAARTLLQSGEWAGAEVASAARSKCGSGKGERRFDFLHPHRGSADLGRDRLDEAKSSRSRQRQRALPLEAGRCEKCLKLRLGPLATAEHDQHVHVKHRPSLMAGRSIYLRRHHALDQQEPAVCGYRLPAVLEDPDAALIVPIVNEALEDRSLRTRLHRT